MRDSNQMSVPHPQSKQVIVLPGPPELTKRVHSLLALANYPVVTPTNRQIEREVLLHATQSGDGDTWMGNTSPPSTSNTHPDDRHTLWITTAAPADEAALGWREQNIIRLPEAGDPTWFSPSAQAQFLAQVDHFFYPDQAIIRGFDCQPDSVVFAALTAQAVSRTSKEPAGTIIFQNKPLWLTAPGIDATDLDPQETQFLAHTLKNLLPVHPELGCVVFYGLNRLPAAGASALFSALRRAYPWVLLVGWRPSDLANLPSLSLPERFPGQRRVKYLQRVGLSPLLASGRKQRSFLFSYWREKK